MREALKGGAHLILTFFFIIALAHAPALAQQAGERMLEQMTSEPGLESPVEIASIKVKGVAIEPGKKFSAEDDWLRELTFTLKNVSDKPISHVAVGLLFPTTEGSQVRYKGYRLKYGYPPPVPGEAAAPNPPKPIMPSESIDLKLTEAEYQGLRNYSNLFPVSGDVETVKYEVDMVSFEGDADTLWGRGRLFRRDPDDPKRFKSAERYTLAKKPE